MKRLLSFALALVMIVGIGAQIALFANADMTEITTNLTGYSGGIRKKSDGSILFSPFIDPVRTLVNGGAKPEQFTAHMTFSLLTAPGGTVVATFDEVSMPLNASNGQYFDIYLNGAKGDSGFCPTAGSTYSVYMEISKNGEKLYFGTYPDITAADSIAESGYYQPTPIPSDPSSYDLQLSYTFFNDLPGSAAGKITVTGEGVGMFNLCWLDKNEKPLTVTAGTRTLTYTELTSFVIMPDDTDFSYEYTVQNFTAIPYGAAKLGICDSKGNVAGLVSLPQSKLLTTGAYDYSYGVISDIHYNFFKSNGTTDDAIKAVNNALQFYKDAGAVMITATGDYGIYGEVESYQSFSQAVAASGMTVLGCGGNHELYADLVTMYGKNGYWRTYMNKGVYDETPMEGVLNVAPNGIDFVYEIPGHTDSVFVFLSQWYWDGHTNAQGHLITDSQVTWLSEQFETYKDRNVYFYFHTYLYDDDGETYDGEGDITNSIGTTYGAGYNQSTVEEPVLRALLSEYKNVTFYNGHSHYIYEMQKFNENLNIFDNYGTSCTMIHVPSVTAPRSLTDTATGLSSLNGTASQGALINVCGDYDIMNGIDLKTGRIFSYACYIVYHDKDEIQTAGEVGDVSWTYDKQTQSLAFTGTGEIPDYDGAEAPWAAYASCVRTIYVGKGVTKVGKNAFEGFAALVKAEMKEGVAEISEAAFENCAALETVILPETLNSIGEDAFAGDEAISSRIFDGTDGVWAAVETASGNDPLTGAEATYRKYTVTWNVDGTETVTEYKKNAVPKYDGIPGKATEDGTAIYLFLGWYDGKSTYATGAALPKATANVTYTAIFGETSERYARGVMSDNSTIWEVDRYTGTLTLTGTGAIQTFSDATYKQRPWQEYAAEITTAVIESGITTLGSFSLAHMPALNTVICADTVKNLNADCFSYNPTLTTLIFNGPIRAIGQGTVYQSNNIAYVTITNQMEASFLMLATTNPYNTSYAAAQYTVQSTGDWDPNATEVSGRLTENTNISWTFDRLNGVLTLEGYGAMDKYDANNDTRPWIDYTTEIMKVVIGDGITSVGNFAFSRCPQLAEVVCGKDVTKLGADAFSYNAALTTIVFNGKITSIGQGTVYLSSNIASVTITGQTKSAFLQIAAAKPYNTTYANAAFTVIDDPCELNGDGVVNVEDATALLNLIAAGAADKGDVDGNGSVAIADVTALLAILGA